MWTTKEGQDILTTMLSLDSELRHAEAGVMVPYGDVDAGKLVEDTRGMFDAIDQVLESERVALGLSCVNMMIRRREIDDVVKVVHPEAVSLGLLCVIITLIFAGISGRWKEEEEILSENSFVGWNFVGENIFTCQGKRPITVRGLAALKLYINPGIWCISFYSLIYFIFLSCLSV